MGEERTMDGTSKSELVQFLWTKTTIVVADWGTGSSVFRIQEEGVKSDFHYKPCNKQRHRLNKIGQRYENLRSSKDTLAGKAKRGTMERLENPLKFEEEREDIVELYAGYGLEIMFQ